MLGRHGYDVPHAVLSDSRPHPLIMTSRPRSLTPGQRGLLTALAVAVGVAALVLGGVLLFQSRPTPPVALETTTGETSAPTTSAVPPSTTTVPETTTTELETTTTTTTPESTTTTQAILDSFVLRPDGIDRMFFGAEPNTVIAELTKRLGPPETDTTWQNQNDEFDGLCGGTEARFVEWETLLVFFTDRESGWAPNGGRHFAAYSVIEGNNGFQFSTSRGIGFGSTVDEVRTAYRDDVEFGVHPVFETEVFEVDPAGDGYLLGFLTGLDGGDVVTQMDGGFSCGE